ncbi:hypothetical protein RJ639_023299 [Escallonia herrerae]|uniref:Uncharacterized protein n=1 Tax=Escallonia herrerae TaxID=1293975 RepID=A0AA88V000_9ASTE|nr:hypothetical protein RJ639_023299 [Escallonia herrerae]
MMKQVIGITSVSLLPSESVADLSPTFFVGLLKALIPSILMNIYVVGLNQLFDVEIDKSFAMGIRFQSPPLFSALAISFVLGSVYSIELPFLRWKRNAFLAATCILIVRAIVVQVAFFLHIQDIPDVDGDRDFGIRSFSVSLGQENMLLMAYGAAVVIGASSSFLPSKLITLFYAEYLLIPFVR